MAPAVEVDEITLTVNGNRIDIEQRSTENEQREEEFILLALGGTSRS